MPRQQVDFRKKSRKIKGCGSLEEDFYTRFIPNFSGFGAVTWFVEKWSSMIWSIDLTIFTSN
ncbi:MAG: hypothetical protein IJC02_09100 [Lachnospiraceae bacterium]|nr:hypothetical protein [Lachnospiraceae bacterium]